MQLGRPSGNLAVLVAAVAALVALASPPPAGARCGGADLSARASLVAWAPCGGRVFQPADTSLSIAAALDRVGYVGAIVTGPPGVSVQVGEQLATGTQPIQVATLDTQGDARLPNALRWSCTQRRRTLIATTLPPAVPLQAAVSVRTPGCAKRLAVTIRGAAHVGGTAALMLADRWRIGGLTATICVSPPGAKSSCRKRVLRPGQSRRTVRLAVPRPGGWLVTASTTFGYRTRATVWVSHPGGRLTLLAAGDSEMQILDTDIAQDLAPHGVGVVGDARISTSLTNPGFFNWEAHARTQAATLRPDVTVMFIGANDGFSVSGPGGRSVGCCSSTWSDGYANLVAEMMGSYLRGNAGRVYWFLLPAPRPANFASVFDAVNAGIRRAAARFPGRVALIDANAFFTPGNVYRDYMTYQGRGFVIHESDGIHLSAASDVFAAQLLVRRMVADRLIR